MSFASSSDQGSHWSPPLTVSSAPANTPMFPWVAAYNGIVDVVYYGTSAASNLDPAADWHVYLAQLAGGSFTQTVVNANPNHHGVICTGGTSCSSGSRNLRDLFQVAIDPVVGKAAIIYTDATLTTSDSAGNSGVCRARPTVSAAAGGGGAAELMDSEGVWRVRDDVTPGKNPRL